MIEKLITLFTRKDFDNKSTQEIQEMLEPSIVEFSEVISTIDDETKLNTIEQEIIKKADDLKSYYENMKYTLNDKVTEYAGDKFSKQDVINYILYFLDKQEVEFSYTLGMFQMIELWRTKDLKTISYFEYDSTTRLLNQYKYKGYAEWKKILVIHEYFKSIQEEYVRDISLNYYYSGLHNVIIDKLNNLHKNTEEQPEEVQPN